MGKVLTEISEKESKFIANSRVFFVATAPLSSDHHVNVSPKAPGNACVVLSSHCVAYADLTGSGAETAAHVLQNGRMTLMFCNLQRGPPRILRLFGKASFIMPADCDAALLAKFPPSVTESLGFRAVFKLQVERISTSCGYSLPQMDFVKYRQTLEEYCNKEGKEGMYMYSTKKNSFSIDGLPSLALLREDGPKHVMPVAEDGCIFGVEMRKAEQEFASRDDPVETARKMMRGHHKNDSKLDLTLMHLMAVVVTAFAVGMAAGHLIL